MKYVSPSYNKAEFESQDIITASGIIDNGQGSITDGETTIEGQEGTFGGLFDDLMGKLGL